MNRLRIRPAFWIAVAAAWMGSVAGVAFSQALGTAREIAAALGGSDETVKTRVSNVMQKLTAQDREHAVKEAIRPGWIEV